MKFCPACNQTYEDETLNFCLVDGTQLSRAGSHSYSEPPTILMDRARTTAPYGTRFPDTAKPKDAGIAPWQQQPIQQPAYFQSPYPVYGKNQALPTLSLALGIAGLVLFCCYGGFTFGIAAIITGFFGFNNAQKNPAQYGGKGLALGGIITGAIALGISLLIALISVFSR